MKINAKRVLKERKARSWSQEELAIAAGLNLRTIQRIESEAAASLQSKKAIAAALDIDVRELDHGSASLKRCSDCQSTRLYTYEGYVDATTIGGELLPKLSRGMFGSAKLRPVVCAECGLLKYYAAEESIEKLSASKYWTPQSHA